MIKKVIQILATVALAMFVLPGCAGQQAAKGGNDSAATHAHADGSEHSHDHAKGDEKAEHGCAACKTGKGGGTAWCEGCKVGYVEGKVVKCNACYKGKTGESVWCEKCKKGYVNKEAVKCEGCFKGKTGGEPCAKCNKG